MAVHSAAINALLISERSECNHPALENKRRQFGLSVNSHGQMHCGRQLANRAVNIPP